MYVRRPSARPRRASRPNPLDMAAQGSPLGPPACSPTRRSLKGGLQTSSPQGLCDPASVRLTAGGVCKPLARRGPALTNARQGRQHRFRFFPWPLRLPLVDFSSSPPPNVEQGPPGAHPLEGTSKFPVKGLVRGCTAGRHRTRMSSLVVESLPTPLQTVWVGDDLSTKSPLYQACAWLPWLAVT